MFLLSFVICLFLFCHRHVTILKELDLLITVYSLSTTFQNEKKKSYVTIYKTLHEMSYFKKFKTVLTINFLQRLIYNTLFSIYDYQILFRFFFFFFFVCVIRLYIFLISTKFLGNLFYDLTILMKSECL